MFFKSLHFLWKLTGLAGQFRQKESSFIKRNKIIALRTQHDVIFLKMEQIIKCNKCIKYSFSFLRVLCDNPKWRYKKNMTFRIYFILREHPVFKFFAHRFTIVRLSFFLESALRYDPTVPSSFRVKTQKLFRGKNNVDRRVQDWIGCIFFRSHFHKWTLISFAFHLGHSFASHLSFR